MSDVLAAATDAHALVWSSVTPTGLNLPATATVQDLLQALETIQTVSTGWQWWMGDALNQGMERFPEHEDEILQALRVSDLGDVSPSRITTIRWVCERVPQAVRREGLSFSHHQAVASMEPELQSYWLLMAEAQGWSVRALREAIRADQGPEVDPDAGASEADEADAWDDEFWAQDWIDLPQTFRGQVQKELGIEMAGWVSLDDDWRAKWPAVGGPGLACVVPVGREAEAIERADKAYQYDDMAVALLVRAATNTAWWVDALVRGARVWFILGFGWGAPSTEPHALLVWHPDIPAEDPRTVYWDPLEQTILPA